MAFNDIEKMKNKKDPDINDSWNETQAGEEIEEDVDEEELNSINNQLDLLDNALDELEQKNDDIHAQLVRLLESNRQVRKHFQQMQSETENATEAKTEQE